MLSFCQVLAYSLIELRLIMPQVRQCQNQHHHNRHGQHHPGSGSGSTSTSQPEPVTFERNLESTKQTYTPKANKIIFVGVLLRFRDILRDFLAIARDMEGVNEQNGWPVVRK